MGLIVKNDINNTIYYYFLLYEMRENAPDGARENPSLSTPYLGGRELHAGLPLGGR